MTYHRTQSHCPKLNFLDSPQSPGSSFVPPAGWTPTHNESSDLCSTPHLDLHLQCFWDYNVCRPTDSTHTLFTKSGSTVAEPCQGQSLGGGHRTIFKMWRLKGTCGTGEVLHKQAGSSHRDALSTLPCRRLQEARLQIQPHLLC